MTYYIVNDVDRPYPKLVAQKIGDKLYYMDKELSPRYKSGFPLDRATLVEHFGFEITEVGNRVMFKHVRPSIAVYSGGRSAGKTRYWQGANEFTLEKLPTKEILA